MTTYRPAVSSVHVVVLDPRLAPRDQIAWAFTADEDAQAVTSFLNARLVGGETIAWVELVRLERKLSERVLRYVDCWADVANQIHADD